ncbi:MAG: hypothetical protein ACI4FZ_12425 [Lachnospiraceae bacterium]
MNKTVNCIGNGVMKILGDFEDWTIQSFFDWASENAQDFYSNEKALKKAIEGTKDDCFQEHLKMVIKDFKTNVNHIPLFTEEELKKKFQLLYENLDLNSRKYFDNINQEALFQCFKIYVTEYVKYLENELSMGERRLLERTAEIDDKIDKVLTKEDFEKRSKAHTKFLNILCKDQDKPFIHIIDNQLVSIRRFEYKYMFFNNTFDFAESHDPFDDDLLVLTFSLKNAGKAIIEDVHISDFVLRYCVDAYDDNPECSYYVLPAAKYNNTIQNTLNIVPDCDQKIHIVFRRNATELEDEMYNHFLENYSYDKIQLWFTLTAKTANESLNYDVVLSMSIMNQFDDYNNIIGSWEMDAVSMIEAEHTLEK